MVRLGTQWWTVVVDVPTTQKARCGKFYEDRFTIFCSRPRGWGDGGLGPYVDRIIILHSIYDWDVFSSFPPLYNPYESYESEKNITRTYFLTQKGSINAGGVGGLTS